MIGYPNGKTAARSVNAQMCIRDRISGFGADDLGSGIIRYDRRGAVFELNLGNRVRLDVAAAVDHRGVGAGHFNRTGFVGGAADRIADVEFVLGDAAEAKVLQIDRKSVV